MTAPTPSNDDRRYPDPREIRRLMLWGVCVIAGLLLVAAVFVGIMQYKGAIPLEKTDPIRLTFVIGGTSVAAILSLIALYSVIVRGHLAAFVAVMALIAFGLSAYLILTPTIGEMKQARGVITVIFSVGTISIAMMVVMGALFSKWDSTTDDLMPRFDAAKQVLTMLLGILGTIVGFYFGSTTDDSAPDFAIADVAVSDLTPEAGSSFTLTAELEGGTPPFGYSIKFDNDSIEDIGERQTETRTIQHEISLEKIALPELLGVVITAKDNHGTQQIYEREAGTWVKVRQRPPLTIASIVPSDLRPQVGDTELTLTLRLNGGIEPFDYSIEFTPSDAALDPIIGTSESRDIQNVVALDGIKATTDLGIIVKVSDDSGTKVTQELAAGKWVRVVEPPSDPLNISGVQALPSHPRAGEAFDIIISIVGGKAPFDCTIDFDSRAVEDIQINQTAERVIQQNVSLANVESPIAIDVAVTVVDADDERQTWEPKNGELVVIEGDPPEADVPEEPPVQ